MSREGQTGSQDPKFDFAKYLAGQVEEINSPLNTWGAGERFGHSPNNNERAIHYAKSGGARRYAERHGRNTEGADL